MIASENKLQTDDSRNSTTEDRFRINLGQRECMCVGLCKCKCVYECVWVCESLLKDAIVW